MPAEDNNQTTNTSSINSDSRCVMIYRMPISEERIRYIQKQLSIPIERCKKSSSYRMLLEKAGFDGICGDFYLVPDAAAVTAVICATRTEHFTGWYNAKADKFLEFNCRPFTLYDDTLNALETMMYKASDWMDEPMYIDDDELNDAYYELNDLRGHLSGNLMLMVATASELLQASRSE